LLRHSITTKLQFMIIYGILKWADLGMKGFVEFG